MGCLGIFPPNFTYSSSWIREREVLYILGSCSKTIFLLGSQVTGIFLALQEHSGDKHTEMKTYWNCKNNFSKLGTFKKDMCNYFMNLFCWGVQANRERLHDQINMCFSWKASHNINFKDDDTIGLLSRFYSRSLFFFFKII